MGVPSRLIEIIVCPECRGDLVSVDQGRGLLCKTCQITYPVEENVPILISREVLRKGGGPRSEPSLDNPTAFFRVTSGPNQGVAFRLERGTCKAIGRAIHDLQKTTVFQIDIGLTLDDGTKELVKKYIRAQFGGKAKAAGSELGNFRRTTDVVLDDASISRLHAMIFYDEVGMGILDLVSRNGTFVNGNEIESTLLKKGDLIEVGETKISIED